MKLLYSRVRPNAKPPVKAHPADAGWDVFSCLEKDLWIPSGQRIIIPTGLAIRLELTENQQALADALGLSWYWRAADRSGQAHRGLHIIGGVIDRTYRGELGIIVVNLSLFDLFIEAGEKICQIIPELIADVREAEEDARVALEVTDRGGNGFGSTGSR